MGEFLDAVTGGAVWGIGFALAMGLVRGASGGLRPVARTAVKGAVAAGDWVSGATAEARETLQDLYHEAKAERATGA